jgi:hypothetical protein
MSQKKKNIILSIHLFLDKDKKLISIGMETYIENLKYNA